MIRRYINGNVISQNIVDKAFSENWINQEKLFSNKELFGIYRLICSSRQIGALKLLFLNLNNDYYLFDNLGIGNSWSLQDKGSFITISNKLKFTACDNSKGYFNILWQYYMISDIDMNYKRYLLKSEQKFTDKCYFQKLDFPKILKCKAVEYQNNNFKSSLDLGNYYIIDSKKDNKYIVFTDQRRFRSYPKELFEDEI